MRFYLKYLIVLIALCLSINAYAKTSVWVAEKEGKKIILAGSIHLLKPSQLPLPDAYMKALESSQRIVFELNMDELDQTDTGKKMLLAFQLKGVTLQQTLQPATWKALEKVIKDNNIAYPLNLFDAAFVSFSLPIFVWKRQGYDIGIDEILYKKAKQQKKIIEGLETFDEQLAALVTLKQIDPDALITEMLQQLLDPKLSLERLVADLYQGDQTVLNEQIVIYKQAAYKIFYENLLVNRNQAWLIKIDRYMQEDTPTMIIVGAMHLAGEGGLLQQMAKRGYKITYY